ncbi:hypothetical protein TNCV_3398071 [Trichonephila clavipes]|nr:hypothetical protein TNCV_3398071 [Trichonephila clavipes]
MRLRILWPRLALARYQSRLHPSPFWRFSLQLNTRIRPLGLSPPPEHHRYQCSRPGGSLAHGFTRQAGYVCSHPRVPRAHQAGSSRQSLAGVGLSGSVRCHGPGLALLTNGGVQQQQQLRVLRTLHSACQPMNHWK